MVYVYGSKLCAACQAKRAELDAAGTPFTQREASRLTGKFDGDTDSIDAEALAVLAFQDYELPVVVEVPDAG